MINPIQPQQSPLLNALNAANSTIGILKGLKEVHAANQASDLSDKLNDPNSTESQTARSEAVASLNFMKKRGILDPETHDVLLKQVQGTPESQDESGAVTDAIPGLSAYALKQNSEASPLQAFTKAQLAADGMAAKQVSYNDRNAIGVVKDYEDRMKPYRGIQEDISKVEGALATKDKNGNPLITAQQLGDVNAAIARIYSPGHMSDATVSRTEYESAPARFAAAVQKLMANPQDVGSRDLINHIIDQAHHLGNVSNQNAQQELDSLDAGVSGLSPAVQKATLEKSKAFRARFSKQYPTVGDGSDQNSGGGQNKPPGSNQQFTPDVMDYASKHQITPAQAQAIKVQRGG